MDKGHGPFTFAIDTSADVSMVSSRVAQSSGLAIRKSKRPIVAGLSNAAIASNEEAIANELSLGTKDNHHSGTTGSCNRAITARWHRWNFESI